MTRSTTWSSRPLARISLLLAVTAVAVSACSSGQVTQTAVKRPSVQGVNATKGDIAVRNVALESPEGSWTKGGTAHLLLNLVNTGGEADTLIGVETPAARFVGLSGAPASGRPLPSGSAAPSDSASPSESAPGETPSASPTTAEASASPSAAEATATPSATSSAGIAVGEPAPNAPINLTVPAATLIAITADGTQLVMYDIQQEIRQGDLIELTLRFERAGTITLRVPVAPPTTPLPRASAIEGVGEHAEEGEH